MFHTKGPLSERFPKVAKEWDYEKNAPVKPNEVAPSSRKYFSWRCKKCGGGWEAPPRARCYGVKSGCPYCAGKRVHPAKSLAAKYPELAAEWHTERNGDLQPDQILPGSNKKVWWRCPDKGHEYDMEVWLRTGKNQGCPYCTNKRVGVDNNLAVLYPDLVKEWHPTKNGKLTPYDVVPGSDKNVWWQCKKGHEWRTKVELRALRGYGCPYCSGRLASPDTCLATLYPEIAKEWHPTKNAPLTPDDVTSMSSKKVWWQCLRGHEWKATIGSRSGIGAGCPICARGRASLIELEIYCELKQLFKPIKLHGRVAGNEVDILLPNHKVGIEVDGKFWHKNRARQDKAKGKAITAAGVTLVRLREQPLKKLGEWDVAYASSENRFTLVCRLLEAINNAQPSTEIQDKWKWYVEQGTLLGVAEFQQIVSTLPAPPYENSLAHLHPHIAEEWHYERNTPLTPDMFTISSPRKVWWQCKKGHEWEAAISSRTGQKQGCPYCSGRLASPEYNLATQRPDLIPEWHIEKNAPLKPEDVTPGSNRSVWWRCQKCGHEYKKTIHDRTSIKQGCRACSKKQRSELTSQIHLRKWGSLLDNAPNLAAEWHSTKNGTLTPADITTSSNKLVWWKCRKCGYEWEISPRKRIRCPSCGVLRPKD